MSRDASVVRDAAGLTRLSTTLSRAKVRAVAGRRDFEDVALAVAARAVTAAALARTESRGCHHREEHPQTVAEQARSNVLRLADDQNSVLVEALAAVV
ncbi:L-aspartate oxidase [Mycobacterium intracellulare subsp. yongonense]|nr:L-aspartate oxidase [Mycobacterium intracellulare subsp. yongonense]